MDPVKIAGVADGPTPGSKKGGTGILGFTNFYRRFIRDSLICPPLFDLTRKQLDWHWEAAESPPFEAIRNAWFPHHPHVFG